jgi:hypothetical protein
MDLTEKAQFIDVIKGDMKKVAAAEAEGQFAKAEELNKALEANIQKSLEGFITKEEFDKMEGALQKKISDFDSGQKKDISFTGEMLKGLTDRKDDLIKLSKGNAAGVAINLIKVPTVFTSANSLGVTTATEGYAVNNNMEIVPLARRTRHVREVFGMGATDEAVYPYLRETPKEGAIAVQNPEGAAKAQIEYQAVLATATESTIAAFQLIGRQTLRNVRGIGTFINVTMIADLMLKEDNDLLFGTGTDGQVLGSFTSALDATDLAALTTFKTAAPNIYDAIASFAALLANREYMANFAFIHPVDYWRMLISKDTQNRYQQNVIFDSASSMLYVFGIPVIPTTAVAIGNIGVGDSRYVMPMNLEGMTLRFFDQDSDNVQKNLVTARIEESILNVVRRTDAFAYDTLANVITAITPA